MTVQYRRATRVDVPAIVALLADDILGATRDGNQFNFSNRYYEAFAEIDADKNQYLCVVEDDGNIVGTLQLSFIPGLARGGAKRGQIEAVRIATERRGQRIGEEMFAWAVEKCKSKGCSIVQLTTDKSRPDAHRFYTRLGFEPSHIGYKIIL